MPAWPWCCYSKSSCPLTNTCPFCHRYLCKPAMKPAVPGACAFLCNLIPFPKLQLLPCFLIFHMNPKRQHPPLSKSKCPPWCQPWMIWVRLSTGHWLLGRATPFLLLTLPRAHCILLLSTTPLSPWGSATWESAAGFSQVILKQNKEEETYPKPRVVELLIPHWCLPQVPIKSYYFVSQALILNFFILFIKQNKPGGKSFQLPPWQHHPSRGKSPHFRRLDKLQLWFTHGGQQAHPISQMCLYISILFLGVYVHTVEIFLLQSSNLLWCLSQDIVCTSERIPLYCSIFLSV